MARHQINLLKEDTEYKGKRKNSKSPRNDFEYDEGEVCGFTDQAPIVAI